VVFALDGERRRPDLATPFDQQSTHGRAAEAQRRDGLIGPLPGLSSPAIADDPPLGDIERDRPRSGRSISGQLESHTSRSRTGSKPTFRKR
jgi:hypothetical protein